MLEPYNIASICMGIQYQVKHNVMKFDNSSYFLHDMMLEWQLITKTLPKYDVKVIPYLCYTNTKLLYQLRNFTHNLHLCCLIPKLKVSII